MRESVEKHIQAFGFKSISESSPVSVLSLSIPENRLMAEDAVGDRGLAFAMAGILPVVGFMLDLGIQVSQCAFPRRLGTIFFFGFDVRSS